MSVHAIEPVPGTCRRSTGRQRSDVLYREADDDNVKDIRSRPTKWYGRFSSGRITLDEFLVETTPAACSPLTTATGLCLFTSCVSASLLVDVAPLQNFHAIVVVLNFFPCDCRRSAGSDVFDMGCGDQKKV